MFVVIIVLMFVELYFKNKLMRYIFHNIFHYIK